MDRGAKLGLIIGFASISVAVIAAYLHPATGYELSIYSSTPPAFWAGIGISILISFWLLLARGSAVDVTGGLSLGVASGTVMLLLPMLRGYYMYGEADSMTHLGYVLDLSTGAIDPHSILYPGLHLVTNFVSEVTAIAPNRAIVFTMSIFAVPWLLFLPLVVRELSPRKKAVSIWAGLVAALAFAPFNQISLHPRPHPATLATIFSISVIFVFLRLRSGNRPEWVVAFLLFAVALMVYHPQIAIVMVILVISAWLVREFEDSIAGRNLELETGHIALYLAFGLVIWLWIGSSALFDQVLTVLFGHLNAPVDAVSARTSAASELGVSTRVLALKIGAKVILLSAFATGLLLSWRERDARVWHLAFASVPIGIFVGLFAATGQLNQFTRYIGFGVVIASILGGVGLVVLMERSQSLSRPQLARGGLVSLVAILLVISTPTIFIDPYAEKPNFQVSEGMYTGYETTFSYQDRGTPILFIRSPPIRYADAIYGTSTNHVRGSELEASYVQPPEDFLTPPLHTQYDGSRYLMVTEADYKRDVQLYKGIRYGPRDFEYLQQDSHVTLIYSNGEAELYLLTP